MSDPNPNPSEHADVAALRRLDAIRRDFVANVSHELKTPVTAVRGMVETILDDPDMPTDTQRQFLGRVHGQILRLSSLVTDLLTLSRLESAEAPHEAEPLDLREPVRACARALAPPAEARGVTLATNVPGRAVTVQGDAVTIEQAVTNLLDNAVKYTPSGGRVELRLDVHGASAVIEVADTGPGVPAEHRDRVFERFYRIDKARSRELGGTGLGLSIVKHVCRMHGGDVALEPNQPTGARFRIRLPLTTRAPA